jgi:hypothetical protein
MMRGLSALSRLALADAAYVPAASDASRHLIGIDPEPDGPPASFGKFASAMTRELERWLVEAHVVPSAELPSVASSRTPSSLFAVGGVAGALAAAMWTERLLPLRTAICETCGTTWRPGRDWSPDLLVGSNRRCATCRNDDHQRAHRERLKDESERRARASGKG